MIRFKTFVTEQKSSTSKVYIDHLDKMKPLRFLELAQKLNDQFGGILSKEHVEVTEKVDGSALRIGQNESGRPFIESSTSPSMFDVGDFVARDKSKGYDGSIGAQFDALLKQIKADAKVQAVLSKFNDSKGIKVIGEVLYLPMGIDEVDKIKFIRISYDKDKLGTEWTFIPFSVVHMDGTPHPKEDAVKSALYAISSTDRKYVKPTLKISKDIDISIELGDIDSNVIQKYDNLEQILTSRKKIDAELKQSIVTEVSKYQQAIAKKILSHVKSGAFGVDLEGIVLKLSDGSMLKIVTDKFKSTEFKNK